MISLGRLPAVNGASLVGVPVPGNAKSLVVYNPLQAVLYLGFGGAVVTATSNDVAVAPQNLVAIPVPAGTHQLSALLSYPGAVPASDAGLSATIGASPDALVFAGAAASAPSTSVELVGYAGVVLTTVVTVGSVPTPLPAGALTGRRSLTVQAAPDNTGVVFIGGAGVTADETATGGLQLTAGGVFSDALGAAVLYGIVAAGTAKLIVYEAS